MVWTLVMVGAFALQVRDLKAGVLAMAEIQARPSFDKDLVYRRWATGFGGVYVPVSEKTPPDPYLADVENRDVTTTSGLELTLVNPMHMTRQVHELGREQYGHQGHITGLDPLRPENAPDPWEAEALRSFERGETEVVSLELIDGEEYLRFMRPLLTEQGCLKCHAQQGYEVGGIHGGMSVSVPTAPLWSAARRNMFNMAAGFAAVWLVGMGGIGLGARDIERRIRERDRAQTALTKSESLLSTTGRMARVGGWEVDAETLEVRWTEQTYRIHEIPVGERPTLEEAINFFHPEDRPKLERAMQRALENGEPYDMEIRFITAEGRQLWIHIVCEPKVVDGKTLLLSGTLQDVTGRKKAELALREEKKKYRALFDNASDAVLIAQNRVIRFANPATEELLGFPQQELASTDFSRFIHEEDRTMVGERYDRRLNGEAPPGPYAFRIVDKAGHTRWVELKATVLLWDEEPATLCFMRDITERVRTEEELEKHRGRLQELVEERTADLKQRVDEVERLNRGILNLADDLQAANAKLEVTARQLENVNKELEAFAYSVSHDLRAPLRHIAGFVDILGKNSADTLDESGQRHLQLIAESAGRMGTLIDDLLEFARAGRMALPVGPLDLGRLTDEVLQEVQARTEGREIAWEVGALPEVLADRATIRQVLVNLLENAVKYTRPRESTRIEIGTAPGAENELVVFVRDNGVGFDPRYAHKLFGVFQRLHRAEEFEGSGIGLANVRRIISRHGGRTWAEGEVGEGATFFFSLPRKEER
ncbi:MAG: PAS domain S-box protein [Thermoanaerobaculales bacterium]